MVWMYGGLMRVARYGKTALDVAKGRERHSVAALIERAVTRKRAEADAIRRAAKKATAANR